MEDIRAIYEVNVFKPIRVTQALQGLLKAASSACVINMSSGLGSLSKMFGPTSEYGTFNHTIDMLVDTRVAVKTTNSPVTGRALSPMHKD
jgi:NAD(P)-dependent dehydrogenase (short-subunit alcohol dehydrogenase family)